MGAAIIKAFRVGSTACMHADVAEAVAAPGVGLRVRNDAAGVRGRQRLSRLERGIPPASDWSRLALPRRRKHGTCLADRPC